jgi:hypothetical protein
MVPTGLVLCVTPNILGVCEGCVFKNVSFWGSILKTVTCPLWCHSVVFAD